MLVIDTETGGLDAGRCALVSVAALHLESGAEFSLVIRPHAGLEIDAEALGVHGFTPDYLETFGMEEGQAMRMFAMWLHVFGKHDWCGCNPHFDRAFVDAAFARHGIEKRLDRRPVCLQTMAWLAHAMKKISLPIGRDGLPKRSLDAILEALGLARGSEMHDALEDAKLTGAAFRQLHAKISGH